MGHPWLFEGGPEDLDGYLDAPSEWIGEQAGEWAAQNPDTGGAQVSEGQVDDYRRRTGRCPAATGIPARFDQNSDMNTRNEVRPLGHIGRDAKAHQAGEARYSTFSLATTRRSRQADGDYRERTDRHWIKATRTPKIFIHPKLMSCTPGVWGVRHQSDFSG